MTLLRRKKKKKLLTVNKPKLFLLQIKSLYPPFTAITLIAMTDVMENKVGR